MAWLSCRLLPLLTLAAICSAAELPPILDTDAGRERPRIQETGSLLAIDAPGTDNRAGTPPGMLAARLAENDKIFRWSPSPATSRITGGAALAAAALSPDESVLVIAETVGAPAGPNSTRLLYFNVLNGKLINAKLLEGRRLASLEFAGYDRLLAIEAPQPELNRPERLLLFDPADPADLLESAPAATPVLSAVSDGTRTWYTCRGNPYFLRLENGAFQVAPQRQRTLVPDPRLVLTADRKHLHLFGAGRVEFYKLTIRGAELVSSVELPAAAVPEWGAAASADGSWLVLGAANRPAWLVGRNTVRQLADKCSALGCLLPSGEFLLGVPVNESLALYRLPEKSTPSATVSPRKIKPVNRNDNFRIFPLSGTRPRVLQIDHRGNLWQLEIRPRRWVKTALYTVE